MRRNDRGSSGLFLLLVAALLATALWVFYSGSPIAARWKKRIISRGEAVLNYINSASSELSARRKVENLLDGEESGALGGHKAAPMDKLSKRDKRELDELLMELDR